MLSMATIKGILHMHHPAHPVDSVFLFITSLLIFIPLFLFLYGLVMLILCLISDACFA